MHVFLCMFELRVYTILALESSTFSVKIPPPLFPFKTTLILPVTFLEACTPPTLYL